MKRSLIALFLLTSCGFAPEPFYERDEPPRRPGAADPVAELKASSAFEEINALVIRPHCLNCHNPQTTKGNVDLSSLNAIMASPGVLRFGDPDRSSFYTTILEGSMPARAEPLNDELTDLVRRWILEN